MNGKEEKYYLHKEVQMKGLVSRRMRLVILSLSLMVVFGLLMNANEVQAQDNLKFVTLFEGQSATVSFSQAAPFGVSSVFVTSIGNRTMSANFSGTANVSGVPGQDAAGFWFVTILGTGGVNFFDLGAGYIPLSGGQNAIIDIGNGVSFCLATASVFLSSLGDDDSYGFSIQVRP